jgi:hypothetical protein
MMTNVGVSWEDVDLDYGFFHKFVSKCIDIVPLILVFLFHFSTFFFFLFLPISLQSEITK